MMIIRNDTHIMMRAEHYLCSPIQFKRPFLFKHPIFVVDMRGFHSFFCQMFLSFKVCGHIISPQTVSINPNRKCYRKMLVFLTKVNILT